MRIHGEGAGATERPWEPMVAVAAGMAREEEMVVVAAVVMVMLVSLSPLSLASEMLAMTVTAQGDVVREGPSGSLRTNRLEASGCRL